MGIKILLLKNLPLPQIAVSRANLKVSDKNGRISHKLIFQRLSSARIVVIPGILFIFDAY
ncbi:hypothetical protein ADH74_16815 [Bacteroides caecimuris]|nr:hypothetical protein ADH74_16815 [Bacteroides caecimuris]